MTTLFRHTMILTRADISRFQIDPRAIELVPESVARETLVLPVHLTDDMLHLVLPVDAELGTDYSLEKLRFVLNRPFTHQFALSNDLRPFVDFFYTAVYSEITNCDAPFRFQCPKRWAELTPTDDTRVRFCGICQRSVTFCTELKELVELTKRDKCVAFYDRIYEKEFLGLPL